MPEAHRCLAYLWYYQDKINTTSTVKDTPHIYECTSKIHPGDFARWVDENAPSEIRRFEFFFKSISIKHFNFVSNFCIIT